MNHYEEYDRLKEEMFSSLGVPSEIVQEPQTIQEALVFTEYMIEENQRFREVMEFLRLPPWFLEELLETSNNEAPKEPVNWRRDGF